MARGVTAVDARALSESLGAQCVELDAPLGAQCAGRSDDAARLRGGGPPAPAPLSPLAPADNGRLIRPRLRRREPLLPAAFAPEAGDVSAYSAADYEPYAASAPECRGRGAGAALRLDARADGRPVWRRSAAPALVIGCRKVAQSRPSARPSPPRSDEVHEPLEALAVAVLLQDGAHEELDRPDARVLAHVEGRLARRLVQAHEVAQLLL